MAAEVASAYVTILPSARGFQGKLQRELQGPAAVEGERAGGIAGQRFSQSFSSKLGSRAKAMFAPVARAAGYGALAIGAAATAATIFGLKTASAMEQAQVGFTTMLGSAKRAHVFLLRLRDFANKTPFEFADVTRASQRLLAMGFRAKQVLPTLTAIGDAAAGLGIGAQGIDQITTAIGQMQAKGKVQSDELLQLTEAGVPALRILAAGFGKTTAKMQQMVTDGVVPSNKAIPILIKGLEKGTKTTSKFGGLMARQSKTLGGLWSTFKDTVTTGLSTAVQPLVPILERALPSAMTALQQWFGQAAMGATVFIRVLQGGKGQTQGFLGGVTSVATFLRDKFVPAVVAIWKQAVPALAGFITSAARLGSTLWPSIQPVLKLAGGAALGGIKTLNRIMGTLADHATTAKIMLSGIAALWAGKKLAGGLGAVLGRGGGGGSGVVGRLFGQKPLPVYVTNWGVGGGPGGVPVPGGKPGKFGRTARTAARAATMITLGDLIAEQIGPTFHSGGFGQAFKLGQANAMANRTRGLFKVGANNQIDWGKFFATYNTKQAEALERMMPRFAKALAAGSHGNYGPIDRTLTAAERVIARLATSANSDRRSLRSLLLGGLPALPRSGGGVSTQDKINAAAITKHQRLDATVATAHPMAAVKVSVPQPTWISRFLLAEKQPASVYVNGDIVVQGMTPRQVISAVNRRHRTRALSGTPVLPHGI